MKEIITNICSINSKYIHSSLAPWCLFAGVKRDCNKEIIATVIEGTINENINDIFSRLIENEPQIISFCTYIWNVNYVFSLSKMIKEKNKNITIILGGPEVSYNAFDIIKSNNDINYILCGEGEESYPALINAIQNNSGFKDIDGIVFKDKEKIFESAPAILDHDPVSPYGKEYFENLKGRIAYLETSRGCPYSCAFCLSGRCGRTRFFDIDRAKSNIILLSNSGAKTIKLVDRTFNANKKRANELFNFIIENYLIKIPQDVCFHFEIAGDILCDETIEILNNAPKGLIQLEIGLQSFNEKTLSYINRKTDTKKLKENIIKLLKNHNMHIHIDLIAGLPFEDMKSFKDSFNTAYELRANMLQLGFLKLLFGADMREDKKKYPCEFSPNPPYEITKTPYLDENDIRTLKGVEDALERLYNSGRFSRTLSYVLKASRLLPFDLFDGFSKAIKNETIEKIPLDKYTELAYNYFKTLDGVNENILRDEMIFDRLTTNKAGKIPKILQTEDKMLKKYKNYFKEKHYDVKRFSVAILYSKKSVLFVTYDEKIISSIIPINEINL